MLIPTTSDFLLKFTAGVRETSLLSNTFDVVQDDIHYRVVVPADKVNFDTEAPLFYEFVLRQCLRTGTILGQYVFLTENAERKGTLVNGEATAPGAWESDLNFVVESLYERYLKKATEYMFTVPAFGPQELELYYQEVACASPSVGASEQVDIDRKFDATT